MAIYGNANTLAEARVNAVQYPHNSYPIVNEYVGVSLASNGQVWCDYVARLSNGDSYYATITGQPMRLAAADAIKAEVSA